MSKHIIGLLTLAALFGSTARSVAMDHDELVTKTLMLVATSAVASDKCNLPTADVAFLKARVEEIASAVGLDLDDAQVQLRVANLMFTSPTLQKVLAGDRQATIDFCASVKVTIDRFKARPQNDWT